MASVGPIPGPIPIPKSSLSPIPLLLPIPGPLPVAPFLPLFSDFCRVLLSTFRVPLKMLRAVMVVVAPSLANPPTMMVSPTSSLLTVESVPLMVTLASVELTV